ncbi:hypothetical protein JCM21714_4413 [Gracilibacillus boraciitolerans JCM 21714]|uniref:Uncharacterized protein n=1 Tax=Gracilibacillus boraciitolerans JCM 21714 TaxID=1298598 RepID=W4VQR6_9BACI|nr:hypothetical protein JCM21714_4413 [Gracilibacillus boraciitolerans JCM 21714]
MNGDSLIGKFYQFGEAVLFLLYVNFLWIIFSLLGLIFFGIGPVRWQCLPSFANG